MERVLSLARRLGSAIAETDRSKALEEARQAVENDDEGRSLLEEFQSAQQKVAELSQQNKPIEPEDKRRLAEVQQKIAGNESIKALMKAEADYAELMGKINEAIQEGMGGDQEQGQNDND